MHHWSDWHAGLRELRRVARSRVVILTFDPHADVPWLVRDYFPAIRELDLARFPPIGDVVAVLGGRVEELPIPADCTDGFLHAYWRRPERYLDPRLRAPISSFQTISSHEVERGVTHLARDLASGEWVRRNGDLLALDALECGYRLVIAERER
jgi:hypothetical protein